MSSSESETRIGASASLEEAGISGSSEDDKVDVDKARGRLGTDVDVEVGGGGLDRV